MPATESACDKERAEIAIVLLGREYGSADFHTLAELETHLLAAIDRSPAGLLIDLSETIHIGCEFLNILLRCLMRVRENNGRFALCSLDLLPESVFAITCLDALWEIFPTRREAIEAMQRTLSNEYPNDRSRGNGPASQIVHVATSLPHAKFKNSCR